MGVNFKGNPRIRHFLLADNYPEEIFPLRKNQVTEQT
jgi:Ni,Fe-hydrogenase III component G